MMRFGLVKFSLMGFSAVIFSLALCFAPVSSAWAGTDCDDGCAESAGCSGGCLEASNCEGTSCKNLSIIEGNEHCGCTR